MLGLTTQSEWINNTLFVDMMEHFIKFANTSKENPSLLIMDNFENHISIKAIELTKENGVTILTVPAHSTQKMQPLNVCIYKPFKTAYCSCRQLVDAEFRNGL
ncbi:uncharacterized protein [Diabrotica undecimpunctata]|uniref:uncharacterized protein n=1 Tax=Diabrotica undecimpunctata TaxID=50387 RepID=UPI003B637786